MAKKTATQMVYFFEPGKAEGRAEMKGLLGGKGANLAEMCNSGLPVPPGFTITTEACDLYYQSGEQWPDGLAEEVEKNLVRLETLLGQKLGAKTNPLLVSVRSGAAVSMPGMMDTVLNLGLNDEAVLGLIEKTRNPRFAWDCYRRFITMFGDVVMGVEHAHFEHILNEAKKAAKVKFDSQLTAEQLEVVVEKFKAVYKRDTKENFPTDPREQLRRAVNAVFGSWNNPRAIKYREINEIKGLMGTAVNVQTMVYGNMGHTSFTGVGFTRDPATGENKLYGEYLVNAQGEDVVAGIRTPKNVNDMPNERLEEFADSEIEVSRDDAQKMYKAMYQQLLEIKHNLESHYKDVQDFEFTAQEGKLYMLQTRSGKRTAQAAVNIAVDMVREQLIDEKTALLRINPMQIDHLLHKHFDQKAKEKAVKDERLLGRGLPASPGSAVGRIALTAERAEEMAQEKHAKSIILVREETTPEDIGGMHVASGILTARGGMTSHAAVVARGMGKTCVAGCGAVQCEPKTKSVKIAGKLFKEGDVISIDGSSGEVFDGEIPLVEPSVSGAFATLMGWADKIRKLGVRTNADTPQDAVKARSFGAEGIGLCRTEHMFFDEKRIAVVRQMMLSAPEYKRLNAIVAAAQAELENAKNPAEAKRIKEKLKKAKDNLKKASQLFQGSLRKLLPMQRKDFEGIFTAMDGLPVTIRLLDPPLHEFLPHEDALQQELADMMGLTLSEVKARINDLKELNPMLGHRGCRLGITYPELYMMQVQAIIDAACNVQKKGIDVHPEIMIPLIGTRKELEICDAYTRRICDETIKARGAKIEYKVGTMIEIPRAALTADQIAEIAEFFSFGTNDLTQMTFGYSRDDAGVFLPDYLQQEILPRDPFQALDQAGVGLLVEMGVKKGRQTRPNLKVGICGEHGGEPSSVEFCHRVGMNYVSCSPYRVPIARLAAAQAVVKESK